MGKDIQTVIRLVGEDRSVADEKATSDSEKQHGCFTGSEQMTYTLLRR